jgi:hypothetical protein
MSDAGWPTDEMVETARSVHTAGFGLPVAAVAVRAIRTVVAPARRMGATRHALTPTAGAW